jgi:hypothetical protein
MVISWRTHSKNRLITEIGEIFSAFDLYTLQNSPLSVENDEFLELLIDNIRNDVIDYEGFIFQTQKKVKMALRIS